MIEEKTTKTFWLRLKGFSFSRRIESRKEKQRTKNKKQEQRNARADLPGERSREEKTMKKRQAAVLTAVLAAAALSACAANGGGTGTGSGAQSLGQPQREETAGTVSADGTGEVFVAPDIAAVYFSVITEGTDAETVRDQSTEEYNQVVAFLKERGVEEGSIATTNVFLNPQYDWSGETQKIVGYTMQTDITVSDIPIGELGSLLDEAVSRGINGIQNVQYLSSAYDEKYQEALQLAVENARSKAEAMAEASGISLGSVTGVTEYTADTGARYAKNQASMAVAAEAAADAGMNMMPGELSIKAEVNAVFSVE